MAKVHPHLTPDLQAFIAAQHLYLPESIKKVLRACAEAGAYEVIYAVYQMR